MDEIELILWIFLVVGSAGIIAAFLFYGGAFLIQRIKLLWIEVESGRIDMLAKRANVKMALDQNDLQTQVISLDANGLPPISRRALDSGMTTEATLHAILAYIDAQRTHAPVPHTLSRTYAPHIKQDKFAVVEDEPALPEAPLMDVKDFFQLYEAGALPSNKLLLGFDMDTWEAVIVGWEKLYSCLIGGLSQMGKSTLIRNLLAQSALQGGHFIVLDPHFKSGDKSLGASLTPLASRMMRDVAYDDKTMASALKFVLDIVDRRLAGKDKDRTPLVLVVDECTGLLRRGAIAPQLIAVLEKVAQESAKVHVFAMCIGQNFNAETMPSVARNSFVSMISCKARRTVARVQADNPEFGRMAQTLDRGQIVFMPPTGQMRRIAVPNTTAEHLAHVGSVLNATKNTSGVWEPTGETKASRLASLAMLVDESEASVKPAENQDEANSEALVLDENAQRALAMFNSGKDIPEIIQAVWGLTSTGGKAYQKQYKHFQAILRTQTGAR